MANAAKGALSKDEVAQALHDLPAWKPKGEKAVARQVKCAGFPQAIALVNAVAEVAQRRDHHPDMLIEFDKVTFTLSSHDAGGVTRRDLELAREIDAAAEKAGAKPA